MSDRGVSAEIERLKSEIEALRNSSTFNPSSIEQSVELAGLNARLCSALMQDALDKGKPDLAMKWSREQQAWAQQRSRDAKLEKVDRLRELQRRVDLKDTRRKDFQTVRARRRELDS